MVELDSFLFLEFLVLELVGALEDPHFVASLLDTNGCFEEVECFLCPGLAPGFVPWGTLSALEEGLGDLKTTSSVALHIANMWRKEALPESSFGRNFFPISNSGKPLPKYINGWWCNIFTRVRKVMCTNGISKGVYPYFSINTIVGIKKETLKFSRAVAEYQNSARRATSLFVLRMISLRLKLTCLAATKGLYNRCALSKVGERKFWIKALNLQFSSVSTKASGFESMFSIPSSLINLLKDDLSRGLMKISAS
ncbi:hypothetical protein Tco_0512294 [Tanacetum coccineum]